MVPAGMTDTAPEYTLVIRRKDFLSAVRAIKPKRVNVADKLSEFQFGFIDGEAVFCRHGAQTRRPASGNWPGFACFRFAMMLAVLKIPPPGDPIEIRCSGKTLQIGSTKVSVRWIGVSEWIAELALEAHLHGPDDEPVSEPLYCPRCGKREGILFSDLPRKAGRYPVRQEQLTVGGDLFGATPTRECRICRHRWIELDD